MEVSYPAMVMFDGSTLVQIQTKENHEESIHTD